MSVRFSQRLKSIVGLGSEGQSPGKDDLFRTMSTLAIASLHVCDDDQLEVYDQALLELVDLVEAETRRVAAQRIAELDRAPTGLVRRLARDDEITVAAPILSKSPLLTDEDLIEICQSQSDLHLMAVAERRILTAIVSEALVERGSTSVKIQLANNPGANLSSLSYIKLTNQSAGNYLLWTTLSKRDNLPQAISQRLVVIAKSKIKEKLAKEGRADLAEKLEMATDIASKRVSQSIIEIDTDYEAAAHRLQQKLNHGRLDESLVRRYALEDRFADAVVSLAALSGFRHDCIAEWMTGSNLDPLLVIAKAHAFEPTTVQALLKCGPRRQELTKDMCAEAVQRFNDLTPHKSGELIATWRKSLQSKAS